MKLQITIESITIKACKEDASGTTIKAHAALDVEEKPDGIARAVAVDEVGRATIGGVDFSAMLTATRDFAEGGLLSLKIVPVHRLTLGEIGEINGLIIDKGEVSFTWTPSQKTSEMFEAGKRFHNDMADAGMEVKGVTTASDGTTAIHVDVAPKRKFSARKV